MNLSMIEGDRETTCHRCGKGPHPIDDPNCPPNPIASFFVPGIPQPGGSKKAFVNPNTGRAVIVEDAKRNKPWRASVQSFAVDAYGVKEPSRSPIKLTVQFYMPRPKGHYGTGKNAGKLKESMSGKRPVTRPDATKLLRSTEDALTGILWVDDSQIVEQTVEKFYSNSPGALIVVQEIPG